MSLYYFSVVKNGILLEGFGVNPLSSIDLVSFVFLPLTPTTGHFASVFVLFGSSLHFAKRSTQPRRSDQQPYHGCLAPRI